MKIWNTVGVTEGVMSSVGLTEGVMSSIYGETDFKALPEYTRTVYRNYPGIYWSG